MDSGLLSNNQFPQSQHAGQSTVPQPGPRFKLGKKEIIALVIIALILAGGVYALKYFIDRRQVACIQVVTKARNPQTGEIRTFGTLCDVPKGWIEVNDTSNWKTYRNEEYGFELKYPENFLFQARNKSQIYLSNFDFDPEREYFYFPEKDSVLISMYFEDAITENLRDLFDKKNKNFMLGGSKASREVAKEGDLIFLEGSKVRAQGILTGISVSTVKGDTFYSFDINPYNSLYENIYNQILSTFKFIEPVSLSEIPSLPFGFEWKEVSPDHSQLDGIIYYDNWEFEKDKSKRVYAQTFINGRTWVAEKVELKQSELNLLPDFSKYYDDKLLNLGWRKDDLSVGGFTLHPLSADGHHGGSWGYLILNGGQLQMIELSQNTAENGSSNLPESLSCPCTTKFRVFVSDITSINEILKK